MTRTPSTMTPLGTAAPHFALPDTAGTLVSISDFADAPALLVTFLCNHCPYVKHIRHSLADFAREFSARDVAIVGINANDPERYPEDAPDAMKREKEQIGYVFPYLFDATQEVAKAFGAACTPDFFLYDAARRLVYRGQYDGSRPSNDTPVTGEDLRAAMDAVLSGRLPDQDQRPSLGCNIKWRPGNEPAFFTPLR